MQYLRNVSLRSSARAVAVAVVIIACVIGTLALVGPRIGLGINEQSLFYLWFGLTRTKLAEIVTSGLALGLSATALTYARPLGLVLANTALVLVSLIICLVLAEVLARVIDGQPVFALHNWLAERTALLTTFTMNEYHPVLGWIPKPNQSWYPDNPEMSFTNGRDGIRLNRPHEDELPTGAILAVGDSMTAGAEVGDRYAWPAQLETILKRRVINGAAGGWGADQIILRAEDLLPKLAPSILIVSFLNNDVDRAGYRIFAGGNKPYFTMENGSLVQHNRPVSRDVSRLEETPLWLVVPSYLYLVQFAMDRLGWSDWWLSFSVNYVSVDNDPVAVSCALLRRLQTELMSERIDLLFVMQYGGAVDLVKPPNGDSVVACARQLGINTLDLWDDLKAVHDRSFADYAQLWNFRGHNIFSHMSPIGNHLVAEWIAARLTAQRTAQ